MTVSLPSSPDLLDLSPLFDTEVFSSCGEVSPDTVPALSPLLPGEIPVGYERWVEKRQREYRGGRHHARRALLYAGLAPTDIRRGDDGLPLFPEGFCGSITHTGKERTFAAAAVCRSPARVGLDAEQLRLLPEEMLRVILTPLERRRFREQSASGAAPAALQEDSYGLWVFSMKEAFYKCVYPAVGSYFGFQDVEVTTPFAGDAEAGTFQVNVLNPELIGVPTRLSGRYLLHSSRIICAVTWNP